jgi:hypothetical protein
MITLTVLLAQALLLYFLMDKEIKNDILPITGNKDLDRLLRFSVPSLQQRLARILLKLGICFTLFYVLLMLLDHSVNFTKLIYFVINLSTVFTFSRFWNLSPTC